MINSSMTNSAVIKKSTQASDKVEPSDIGVRRKAVDPSQSFIVSAPAGSGKTGLLTLRVLNLLGVVTQPEEILCITFTKKAAREMRERIFDALSHAETYLDDPSALETLDEYKREITLAALSALKNDKERQWRLLDSPRRLNISTIDGFCRGLCNQLPFSSGLGAQAGITEHPGFIYASAVREWLKSSLSKPNAGVNLNEKRDIEASPIQILVTHLDGNLDRATDLLAQLLSVRDQWLPLVVDSRRQLDWLKTFFEEVIASWVLDAVSSALKYLYPYEAEICDLVHYANSQLEDAPDFISYLAEYEAFPDLDNSDSQYWRALSQLLLTKGSTASLRKTVDKRLGFPSSTKEQKAKKQQFIKVLNELAQAVHDIDSLRELASLPDATYSEEQWEIVQALIHILPELAAHLKLQFIQHSAADFSEFSMSAVNALSSIQNSDMGDISLLQRLDYSLKHILIDEFQDTSKTQLELLHALTMEWVPDDERTLFIVGDAMQSCYGFRNANVGIFLNLQQNGLPNINCQSVSLDVNFRSSEDIINWVNATFSGSFPENNVESIGAVKYSASKPFELSDRLASQEQAVHCVAYIRDDENENGSPAESEAHKIAKQILAIHERCPEETVAILGKNRSHLRHAIAALKDHNIDYEAIDIDRLRTRQLISDLEIITRILLNPSDQVAQLAFLRAPWCAMTHSELYVFFNNEAAAQAISFSQRCKHYLVAANITDTNTALRLTRVHDIFARMVVQLGRLPLAHLIELFAMELGLTTAIGNEFEIEEFRSYLQLIHENETAGFLDFEKFEAQLDQLYAKPHKNSDNPVQIMTMHKSKGLEFDHVFLPSLHKLPRPDSPELLYWLDSSTDLESKFVFSPMAALDSEKQDLLSNFIKLQKKKAQQHEELRVLYVACTRAKKSLFLSAELKRDKNMQIAPPSTKSMLGKIWPRVEAQFDIVDHAENMRFDLSNTLSESSGSIVINPGQIKVLPSSWANPSLTNLKRQYVAPPFDNEDSDLIRDALADDASSAIGTLFHSILQQACELGLESYLANVNAYSAQWRRKLIALGIGAAKVTHWQSEFLQVFTRFKNDKTARWLLNHEHTSSECELEIFQQKSDGYSRCVIDRTFVDEQGIRWVIDYKTSRPSGEQTLSEFTHHESSQYFKQLKQYRDLLSDIDINTQAANRERDSMNSPQIKGIKVALYFPFIAHFEELPALAFDYPMS